LNEVAELLRSAEIASVDQAEAINALTKSRNVAEFGVGPVADHRDLRLGNAALDKRASHSVGLGDDCQGPPIHEPATGPDRTNKARGAGHSRRGDGIGPQVLNVQDERNGRQRRSQSDRDRRMIDVSEVEPRPAKKKVHQSRKEEAQVIERAPQRRTVMARIKRQSNDADAIEHLVLEQP
jgi:hypothetical protein